MKYIFPTVNVSTYIMLEHLLVRIDASGQIKRIKINIL